MKHHLVKTILLSACLLLYGCGAGGISEQEAKEIALAGAGISESEVLTMEISASAFEGEDAYVLTFHTDTRSYETIIAKASGEMLRSSYQSRQEGNADTNEEQTPPSSSLEGSSSPQGVLTLEEAKSIAFADAGVSASEATLTKAKNDGSADHPRYEIEFHTSATAYEYEIGPDGTIYQLEQESYGRHEGSAVTLAQAKQLALAKVEGAKESDLFIEEEWDDGMHLYEGEIYYQNIKYEFEIDADSGSFLKWSMDYRD